MYISNVIQWILPLIRFLSFYTLKSILCFKYKQMILIFKFIDFTKKTNAIINVNGFNSSKVNNTQ